MELYTLSKFKKAGQLAFLIGLIFLLNFCGGGGGDSSPVEVTVSNSHFSGSIYGNFYGPSASEIGGVIVLNTLPNTSYYLSDAAFSVIVISGKK